MVESGTKSSPPSGIAISWTPLELLGFFSCRLVTVLSPSPDTLPRRFFFDGIFASTTRPSFDRFPATAARNTNAMDSLILGLMIDALIDLLGLIYLQREEEKVLFVGLLNRSVQLTN
mmetsp:Transcript_14034/g.30489  ORF Transcript_14034/g.30489 Transcript_14034/m.30489 type:complete len:117 (+) Transcript_14034:338-688(+)